MKEVSDLLPTNNAASLEYVRLSYSWFISWLNDDFYKKNFPDLSRLPDFTITSEEKEMDRKKCSSLQYIKPTLAT